MRVCGFDLSGSEAIVAVLDGEPTEFRVTNTAVRKIPLRDEKDSEAVKDFYRLIAAFLREASSDLLAIRQRPGSGKFAAGGVTFKMEALIQHAADQQVVFVSPQKIAKWFKAQPIALPAELTKYQEDAFRTAIVALQDNG